MGLPTKKLDQIIYYERYVVVQAGTAVNIEGEPCQYLDYLTEEEYLDILETLPKENQYLDILIRINSSQRWVQRHFTLCFRD